MIKGKEIFFLDLRYRHIELKTQREALDRTSNLPPEDVHGFIGIDVLFI